MENKNEYPIDRVYYDGHEYGLREFAAAIRDDTVDPSKLDRKAWGAITHEYMNAIDMFPRGSPLTAKWNPYWRAYEASVKGDASVVPIVPVRQDPVYDVKPPVHVAVEKAFDIKYKDYKEGDEPIDAFFAYEWKQAEEVMVKLNKFIHRADGQPIDAATLYLLRRSILDISRTPDRVVIRTDVEPASADDFPAKFAVSGGFVPAIQAHHFGQQFGFRANDRRVTIVRHVLADGTPTTYEVVKDDMRNLMQAPEIAAEIKRLLHGRDEGLFDVPWANVDFIDALFNFSVHLNKPIMEYTRSDKDKTVRRDFATSFRLVPRTTDKDLAANLRAAIGKLAEDVDLPIELAVYMEGQPAIHLVMMYLFLRPSYAKWLSDLPRNVALVEKWSAALMEPVVDSELVLEGDETPRQAYARALQFVKDTAGDLKMMEQNRVALAKNYAMFVRFEPFFIPSGSYDVFCASLLSKHLASKTVCIKAVSGFLPIAMIPDIDHNDFKFFGDKVYHPQLAVGAGKELFHSKDVASYSDPRVSHQRPNCLLVALPVTRRIRMTNSLQLADVESDEDRLDVDPGATVSLLVKTMKGFDFKEGDICLFWCPPLAQEDFGYFPVGHYSFLGSVALTDPCGWYRYEPYPANSDYMLVIPTIDHRRQLAIVSGIITALSRESLRGLSLIYRKQRLKATEDLVLVRSMDRDLTQDENDNVTEFKSVAESKPMFVDISAHSTFADYERYNFSKGKKGVPSRESWDDFG